MIQLLFWLLLAPGAADCTPLPAPAGCSSGPCDVSRTVKGRWCATCRRVLGPDDVRSASGFCKRCDEAPLEIEFCLKRTRYFQASCHPARKGPKPVICCRKVHATPKFLDDTARVTYGCGACGAKADVRSELRHGNECSNAFAVSRVCSKSGTPPHVRR